jgi:hypothetical protein
VVASSVATTGAAWGSSHAERSTEISKTTISRVTVATGVCSIDPIDDVEWYEQQTVDLDPGRSGETLAISPPPDSPCWAGRR